ncbi:BNR repeat-like domain-containing protein [Roseovarius nanhaiticus]|uniref:BNR repeat-like domain-containing protein n=1 Tax=Roseovarius nanhaiticus TaxID=573024 RepID=A0A1N7FCI1_9RHOB|nr:exo-alpha-sialidase [Roseovarius nanhaiticus]SEK57553.1 BNR repeat-like domain-containing protein [Roseovarius nanhaiticus]SIR98002.1 BNR repeat-like domain-containing protein [Roseovarius nanhaiticus]
MALGAVQIAVLALGALSIGLSAWSIRRDVPLAWDWAVPAPVRRAGPPVFETVLDHVPETGIAHSPAIILNEGGMSVLWFAGSQEAQADVDVVGVDIGTDGTVSPVTPRLTSAALADVFEPRQLVVTLGNTIQRDGAEDKLYTTAVSVGGWAMASVAEVAMGPDGPRHARKLNLSPLLNRSFLVKSPMVGYADGRYALPAYFEMGSTYGALVRLDGQGRVRDMRRMAGPMKAIQPMIVPLDSSRAVAFLRNFDSGSRHLLISRTDDGGRTWDTVRETDMPNPSAPVAALGIGEGAILMAVNDDAGDGGILNLVLSEDGGETWRHLRTLEEGGGDARYPMMRALPDGRIALVYSVRGKKGIRAYVFNLAWALGA